jgi:hypothetical protein
MTPTAIHQVICAAQYKSPDCTRVTTRINMMRRMGRVRSTKPFVLTVAQRVALGRALGCGLHWMMHGDDDARTGRPFRRAKARATLRHVRRAKRRRRAARLRQLHSRWTGALAPRPSVF